MSKRKLSDDEDNAQGFPEFLSASVKLKQLQYITEHLDYELSESQRIMTEIRAIYDQVIKINEVKRVFNGGPINIGRSEDVSTFIEADAASLLTSDVPEGTVEVDIDIVLETMRQRAEELRKKVVDAQPQPQSFHREFDNLDMNQYATTLDELSKRLANIKLNKNDEVNKRDVHLENKLMKLCHDVNLFTQMVETKTAISECNKNWPDKQEDNNVLYYDNIISKLLTGINEVTYLMKTKN